MAEELVIEAGCPHLHHPVHLKRLLVPTLLDRKEKCTHRGRQSPDLYGFQCLLQKLVAQHCGQYRLRKATRDSSVTATDRLSVVVQASKPSSETTVRGLKPAWAAE